MLTIALAKGRLARYACSLFAKLGIDTSPISKETRKLIFEVPEKDMRFLLVKPTDVPVYVYHAAADMGIAGKDTLLESGYPLYEMLDLDYAKCAICVAGVTDPEAIGTSRPLRVATKYPRVAQMYYDEMGRDIEVIALNGSIELAPLVGLADVIVDIVESGSTIRENGLSIFGRITDVSARLVVNRVSLKAKKDVIRPLIEGLQRVREEDAC